METDVGAHSSIGSLDGTAMSCQALQLCLPLYSHRQLFAGRCEREIKSWHDARLAETLGRVTWLETELNSTEYGFSGKLKWTRYSSGCT